MTVESPPSRGRFRSLTNVLDTASPVALAIIAIIAVAAVVGLIAGAIAWGDHYARQQDAIRNTQVANKPDVQSAATNSAAAAASGQQAVAWIDNTFPGVVQDIGNALSAGQNALMTNQNISNWNTYRICLAVGATDCIAPAGTTPTPTTIIPKPKPIPTPTTVAPRAVPPATTTTRAPTTTTAAAHPPPTPPTHPVHGKGKKG